MRSGLLILLLVIIAFSCMEEESAYNVYEYTVYGSFDEYKLECSGCYTSRNKRTIKCWTGGSAMNAVVVFEYTSTIAIGYKQGKLIRTEKDLE